MKRGLCLAILLVLGCGDDGSSSRAVGGSSSGVDPFDPGRVTSFRITAPPGEWDALVADPHHRTWDGKPSIRAAVEWEGETYADVGLRPSGNRGRVSGNPKPSLRLNFDEYVPQREFHKFETVKLDAMSFDPSFARERLAYGTYAARGLPTPRVAHARVYVNGAYMGLYLLEERVNKEYVRKRFGNPVNQLYDWTRHANDFDSFGTTDELWRYVPGMWTPEIESLPEDAAGVKAVVDTLISGTMDQIRAVFDVEAFIAFVAVEAAIGEGDAYVGGVFPPGQDIRSGNFYLYRKPGSVHTLLVWDRDQSYWRTATSPFTGFDVRVLTRRIILEVPEHRARYVQVLREVLTGAHETGRMAGLVDSIFDQIRAAALEDPHKGDPFTGRRYSNEDWAAQQDWLKTYIANRNAALLAELP